MEFSSADFVRRICDDYGPRLSGSYGEQMAGEAIYEEMRKFSDDVEKEFYVSRPRAFLDFIWFTASFYILGAVLYFLNLPFFSAILLMIGILIYILQQNLLLEVVDIFFPRVKEFHVIGKIRPLKEAKKLAILSAHYDSAYEFPLLGRHRKKGLLFLNMTVYFAIASIVLTIASIFFINVPLRFFTYALLIISSIMVLYVSLNLRSNRAVPGANDDLAAVASIIDAGIRLSIQRPEKTEVWIVAIAGEEHMRGSKRFIRNHLNELKSRNSMVFNLETPSGDYFLVTTEEKMFLAKHSPEVVDILVQAAEKTGSKYRVGSLPFLGSDGANFSKAGIRAATVFGLCEKDSMPCNWHTMNDVPENLNQEMLEKARDILVNAVYIFDSKPS
ncbi:MAG: M28 family metallopeptidase [Thermoplasmata archaeon]